VPEQPLILVVDDNATTLELVKGILNRTGYRADTAASGREALACLEARPYEVVLTDMMMPEMGGMELLQRVRLLHPDTLVIVLTGYACFQDAVAAVRLGAFDYLIKPVQGEILRHAVVRALDYRRLSRSQRDLEMVFQGAEALGWDTILEQALASPESEALRALRERLRHQEDAQEAGRLLLEAAPDLVAASSSSVFLFDASRGQFSALAVFGPHADVRRGAISKDSQGIMGYVAAHRRPLLVADLARDPRLPRSPRISSYRTGSCMSIPLNGYKFWGVINFADRRDGQPFSPRDLFLGWLLSRMLVEALESREPQEDWAPLPFRAPWVHEDIPLGLALLDQDLKVLRCNPALQRLVPLQGEGLKGQEIFPRLEFSAEDRESLAAAFRDILAHGELREFPALKTVSKDGPPRFFRVKMLPWPGERGNPQGLLLVEEVTELEQLKQRLHLYEHLAIMGKLTLCVAHELNNPLDGIRQYLSLALRKKADPGEVERYLAEAQKGLQKMALSLKSLMFSVNPYQAPPRGTDNLANLLQDALKIMMFQANDQRVQVSLHTPPEFQKLRAAPDLYYVFINLIKNALQAMPRGGRLRVEGSLGRDGVEITFQDTGPGISTADLPQVFQPFYSTKEGAQGLGLGLPICQRLLERCGGLLTVASQPGQGTKVSVILPQGLKRGRERDREADHVGQRPADH
jgi:PAS domain S-box-containing protein